MGNLEETLVAAEQREQQQQLEAQQAERQRQQEIAATQCHVTAVRKTSKLPLEPVVPYGLTPAVAPENDGASNWRELESPLSAG